MLLVLLAILCGEVRIIISPVMINASHFRLPRDEVEDKIPPPPPPPPPTLTPSMETTLVVEEEYVSAIVSASTPFSQGRRDRQHEVEHLLFFRLEVLDSVAKYKPWCQGSSRFLKRAPFHCFFSSLYIHWRPTLSTTHSQVVSHSLVTVF